MKLTENISLGGYQFAIEKDALERLEKYLDEVRSHCKENADEICEDIEERIAELFIEKYGKSAVINLSAVKAVENIIGYPDVPDEGQEEVREETREDKEEKRLFRDLEHRFIGGVCSGIAAYFNIEISLVRLAVILVGALMTLASSPALGVLITVYVAAWIIIPPAKTVEDKCRLKKRPIKLDEFMKKAGSKVDMVAKEVPQTPASHYFKRTVEIIVGIALFVAGTGGLIGLSLADVWEPVMLRFDGGLFYSTFIAHLDSHTWKIMSLCSIALFSIWALYNGTCLTFGIRLEKCKIGLIIFILWIMSLLAICVYLIRELIIMEIVI